MRSQRNSNRDAYEHLTKFEIGDKRQKLKLIEDIISQPEISRDEINKINNDKKNIQNDIEKLEIKVKNSASKSSELSIYKQNATQASSLKEQALKVLEKTERDKVNIIILISQYSFTYLTYYILINLLFIEFIRTQIFRLREEIRKL